MCARIRRKKLSSLSPCQSILHLFQSSGVMTSLPFWVLLPVVPLATLNFRKEGGRKQHNLFDSRSPLQSVTELTQSCCWPCILSRLLSRLTEEGKYGERGTWPYMYQQVGQREKQKTDGVKQTSKQIKNRAFLQFTLKEISRGFESGTLRRIKKWLLNPAPGAVVSERFDTPYRVQEVGWK